MSLLESLYDTNQILSPLITEIFSWDSNLNFFKFLNKFQSDLDQSFPRQSCCFCGILLFPCLVQWTDFHETENYFLETLLGLPLYRKNPSNQSSQIFICGRCKKSPQCPPNCKNFPFSIFQWSQMFLLPLTLQTSLGQTQSAANSWNLSSTYWTVTGKLLILLLSWKNIYINIYQLGVINVTQNYRAQALYTGILGAYLALLEHHIDKNQDASLLTQAASWLWTHNYLIQQYTKGLSLAYHTITLPTIDVSNPDEQVPSWYYCSSGGF